MPYQSDKQRKFMALVHSYQLGKTKKKVGKKVKDAAKSMTKTETHDFMKKEASSEAIASLFRIARAKSE